MNKAKVLIIPKMISPYLVPLFNRLNDKLAENLMVVGTSDFPKSRKKLGWSFDSANAHFKYKILNENNFDLLGLKLTFSTGLWSIFRQGKYDVVIIGGYSSLTTLWAMFLAKLFGVKTILRFGTHKYCEVNPSKILKIFKKFLVRNMDAFIAYGTWSHDFLVDLGATGEKIVIEYNTVDVKTLISFCKQEDCLNLENRNKLKKQLDLFPKTILFVGRLIEIKNILTMLKAMKLINQSQLAMTVGLVIIGSGNQKEMLESYVKEMNIQNVKFIGAVSYQKVANYYMAADIFSIMSIQEPWGLVVNEAMSFGCPVVISKYCGCSIDLVKGNGIVIEDLLNYKTLANAWQKILQDENKQLNMGKESQEIIEKYDIDNAVSAYLEAIHLVVKGKKKHK